MSHRGHHSTLGVLAIVAAIAFAFGERTARIGVGTALVVALLCFAYVAIRIVMGTI